MPAELYWCDGPAAVPDMFREPHDTEPQRGSFGHRTFVLASATSRKAFHRDVRIGGYACGSDGDAIALREEHLRRRSGREGLGFGGMMKP